MKRIFPYKHWCGVVLDTKMEEFDHDCDAWEGEELGEKI